MQDDYYHCKPFNLCDPKQVRGDLLHVLILSVEGQFHSWLPGEERKEGKEAVATFMTIRTGTMKQ